jgi:hypothetical protein
MSSCAEPILVLVFRGVKPSSCRTRHNYLYCEVCGRSSPLALLRGGELADPFVSQMDVSTVEHCSSADVFVMLTCVFADGSIILRVD